jgi:hypothetical protein
MKEAVFGAASFLVFWCLAQNAIIVPGTNPSKCAKNKNE